MNCVFCKITKKEIPAEIIYEDDKVIAFLDVNPVCLGHTLVLPKEHYKDFLSTPDELICQSIKIAKQLAPKIIKAVGATDLNLITNNGPYAGQSVEHLHFHLIPRGKDFPKPSWKTIGYKKGQMEKIAEKIRKYVKM